MFALELGMLEDDGGAGAGAGVNDDEVDIVRRLCFLLSLPQSLI